jgi:hypothetical protein
VHKGAAAVAKGSLACFGRHTLTGMLTAAGKQFVDWSSSYRLFGKARIDIDKLFDVVRANVLKELPPNEMIIAHMDDTIIRKKGKKVFGTGWRRDPLGPAFHTNFIWGQRFLQISLALPEGTSRCQSKAIPIDLHHCPTVKKPNKKALPSEITTYKKQQKISKLSRQGSLRIAQLRNNLNLEGKQNQRLGLCVDGSYTNSEVLKNLPGNVTLIGRIRKDSKLYTVPGKAESVGRKRVYGKQLPSPEKIRKSGKYRWQKVIAWAAGKTHEFNIKIVRNVRWRSAGENNTMQLVIIKPLAYKLSKSSPTLFRQPAYLICTDPHMQIEKLLQAYLWRWEIEVNFRDEKTLMGCGEAQVRSENSVKNVPAFIAAIYSLIHLAAHRSHKDRDDTLLPRPAWDPIKPSQRITSSEIINAFRLQTWCKSARLNFSGFVKKQHADKSQRNTTNPLLSAMFYARK